MRNYSVYLGLTIIFVSMGVGCASTHKTTTTQTTVQHTDVSSAPVKTVEKSTTTTSGAESKPTHTGILGGFFHILGSIIAFPFVVIGNVLQAIF